MTFMNWQVELVMLLLALSLQPSRGADPSRNAMTQHATTTPQDLSSVTIFLYLQTIIQIGICPNVFINIINELAQLFQLSLYKIG